MSQPNANRRWIFEAALYNADCTMLRPEVAKRASVPMVTQLELPFDCGIVLTQFNPKEVMV
jgi:hypothetical protein